MKKCCEGTLREWNENLGITYDEKCSDVFHYFREKSIILKNIRYLVQFSFALLGLNAASNTLWPDENYRLKLQTVKAVIVIKTHVAHCSCV